MSAPVTIREAATVVLLRDDPEHAHAAPQVLLLRRHGGHVFAANAHVFPGGAVDTADGDAGLAACTDSGREYAEARLADTGRALAYWNAAIRECFEEAGMLIACNCQHVNAGRRSSARDALNAGNLGWADVVADLDLRFRLEELVYFAHWITPAGAPKRYSTRFFAARAPADQSALSDGSETTAAAWVSPAAALAAHRRSELHLMTPTLATLERLCEYDSADRALAGLARKGVVRS